jgi:hypothetical protein
MRVGNAGGKLMPDDSGRGLWGIWWKYEFFWLIEPIRPE